MMTDMLALTVLTNVDNFLNDFNETVRAFSPKLIVSNEGEQLEVICNEVCEKYKVTIVFRGERYQAERNSVVSNSKILQLRHFKRFAKRTLYVYLSKLTGITLPYGSLTGIRPTKLYYDIMAEGEEPIFELSNYYLVSDRKIELIDRIISAQKGIYGYDSGVYNAFANIPVCPTRCAYCSFISETVAHAGRYLEAYSKNLVRDIETQFQLPLCKRRAIYVGGGTPTSIADEQLDRILKAFKAEGEEFTVEAGRPETFTREKAEILKRNGVTRISINPQTFKEETLEKIGRKHTVRDIYTSYELAKEYRFDVNMDLISALPGESFDDFKNSIDKAIDLEPENITVHTLSIKRGSVLNLQGEIASTGGVCGDMVNYAYERLTSEGYEPYYMYRQKNTEGRLENVGYAKKGKECVYNIDIMEETRTIHASGAGAISKRVEMPTGVQEARIERLSEIKEIKGYNERIDELLEKKIGFFS